MTPPGPLLSIVVATYNRLPELQTMLDSLLPQVAGKPVEVLIVDDRSTDATWAWLEATFADNPSVTPLLAEKNGGPGPARNVALKVASGSYFMPIDSDFVVIEGAIDLVLATMRDAAQYPLLFFPCMQYPAMRRLDGLSGRREINYQAFMSEQIGELIPVTRLDYLRGRGLAYPQLRAGGESILWAGILAKDTALFIDSPVIYYRTDVGQRICTLEYQLDHPADLAAIADAMLTHFSGDTSPQAGKLRSQKYLAAGTYHLLAGNMATGRSRLWTAILVGCWTALPTLIASFAGAEMFRTMFRFYRTKLRRAYL